MTYTMHNMRYYTWFASYPVLILVHKMCARITCTSTAHTATNNAVDVMHGLTKLQHSGLCCFWLFIISSRYCFSAASKHGDLCEAWSQTEGAVAVCQHRGCIPSGRTTCVHNVGSVKRTMDTHGISRTIKNRQTFKAEYMLSTASYCKQQV